MKKEISLTKTKGFIKGTNEDHIVEMTNPRFKATEEYFKFGIDS